MDCNQPVTQLKPWICMPTYYIKDIQRRGMTDSIKPVNLWKVYRFYCYFPLQFFKQFYNKKEFILEYTNT